MRVRDGNHKTIPDQYVMKTYATPAFRIAQPGDQPQPKT
jgi:hypothetical protein